MSFVLDTNPDTNNEIVLLESHISQGQKNPLTGL
jgi:hypothetical protein